MKNELLSADSFAGDFRKFLRAEFIRRRGKRARYSLRAFARAVGMHHATLSTILAGKRTMTAKSIIRIGLALGLEDKVIKGFLTHNSAGPRTAKAGLHHEVLALDTFSSISAWYHDAILELTRLPRFEANAGWIAGTLGISRLEVSDAIERLTRLGLLEIRAGRWIDASANNTTNVSENLTSTALRALQKKILEKSAEALESLPRTKRDHTSLMTTFDVKDLPRVKELIKNFRFELASFAQREGVVASEVFQLAVSFFPLTKPNQEENL